MIGLKEAFVFATNGKTKADRQSSAAAFANAVVKTGLASSLYESKWDAILREGFVKNGKKDGPIREAALYCAQELCKLDPSAGLVLLSELSLIIDLVGDKSKPVATAAQEALEGVTKMLDENYSSFVLAQLMKTVHSNEGNIMRFTKIVDLCLMAPLQVSQELGQAITGLLPFMVHISADVSSAAKKALRALCDTCMNPDLEPFIPQLVNCMVDMTLIPDTVFQMASTTFVAEVDGASLAILSPVLSKGLLVTSSAATKRQCARIVENMSKLVDEPLHLKAFLPKILPLLEAAALQVSDPACREVCSKAADGLRKKAADSVPLSFTLELAQKELRNLTTAPEAQVFLDVAAVQAATLNECGQFDPKAWAASLSVTLGFSGVGAEAAVECVEKLREHAENSRSVLEASDDVDGTAESLCDLPFGLAYGNKVLLRKTKLKLLRGHKYGLLGRNDSGKTSLMQALADYKIDGFPSASECRTVFVATDIKTELADLSVLDYMFNDPLLKDCGVSREDMEKTLNSVGFKEGAPANTQQKVGTLSGGWRMKLALSRAMLLQADILLLDEPTNHLDAYNVKWVETYLNSLVNVTAIMVSHDAGLLSRVCTDIIEIDKLRLNYFRGNLDKFREARPDASVYFELAKEGKFDFKFPSPGPLPGINSKGKPILKMTNIGFTYPGAVKAQLHDVTVVVTLGSRVACVGENGAGKSTMIKLLTGELEPDAGSGEVWKHPNCRVGYIAQHAFHHIENHLEETANDYIRWRYANGGDREESVKVTSLATEEEQKLMEQAFEISFPQEDGTVLKKKLVVERFTELRRECKTKKGVNEYETLLKGHPGTTWLLRPMLEKQGFSAVLKGVDERIANRAVAFGRPLSKENVEKHLADVGLEPEFSTHMRMAALSGGQKVKVVLASALWTRPHLLILDEPTNYLDRESLGALARAIRAFEGGVVLITHNSQFCDNLCPVVWHLANNTLDVKGDAEWMAEAAKEKLVVHAIDASEMVDKFGNTITRAPVKAVLSGKEKKLKAQRRQKRFKETGDDYDSEEE